MKSESINQRLRELLREIRPQAPHDELLAGDDFVQGLGLDSLDSGNLVVEIEHAFATPLALNAFDELNTLEKLSSFLARRAAASADEAPASSARLAAPPGSGTVEGGGAA